MALQCDTNLIQDGVSDMLIQPSILKDGEDPASTTTSVSAPNHVRSQVYHDSQDIN